MEQDEPEHLDVLIVGAGISGIGAAHALTTRSPGRRFVVLEARAAIGGTWDLFRYPGIRSDSDLTTFGYEFKPWTDRKVIAGGDRILAYLREAVAEYRLERFLRFRQRVVEAAWDGGRARWTVVSEDPATGERTVRTCDWLFAAGGYYRYDRGHTPHIEGLDRFAGPVIHPQQWPEQLPTRGKRIVVIGSGATAVTIVPALADEGAHVTMLQRTPTYVLSLASEDRFAVRLRRLIGDRRAHAVLRRRSIAIQRALWVLAKRRPAMVRRFIRRVNVRLLPEGYPVDEHFNPPYDPWDQRLCFVPDGDLFRAIRDGAAEIVTARIRRVVEHGIELEDGRVLEADVIVTATGLEVEPFGGFPMTADGMPVQLSETVAYKGLMLSGVPNFAFAIGYTNASWTLKVGLVCEYVVRLLDDMDRHGYAVAVPRLPDGGVPTRPLLDFGAGYVRRALDRLPKQGPAVPWSTSTNYADDVRLLRRGPVADRYLHFRARTVEVRTQGEPTAAA
ncbi:NAD(P)/FAD-dependent oxidoreductase [Amnibacterium sp.]|uniref:flavin-containing monooxygenase n=1 Tax=Amnibacterium sp. TaxID=1872496 RepID=UPI002612AF79|nr:NAD(P)/FAD-dependent oxidoreductase [Amnibacterium sp.]MCU1474636.1 Flavin-containing monooxygenase [Amnibacterium sp.]